MLIDKRRQCDRGMGPALVSELESSQKETQSDWLRRKRECFRAVRSPKDILWRSGQRGKVSIGCSERLSGAFQVLRKQKRENRAKEGRADRKRGEQEDKKVSGKVRG